MVAQHGTLNFVGDGAFMVLSLPVSAFDHIDDDADGELSVAEFTKYRPAIVAAVNANVQLLGEEGPRLLQGMMLSPVVPHDGRQVPTDQLVVMGRFALAGMDTQSGNALSGKLRFHLGLFGNTAEEQLMEMTATRVVEPKKHKFVLTPKQPDVGLFLGGRYRAVKPLSP